MTCISTATPPRALTQLVEAQAVRGVAGASVALVALEDCLQAQARHLAAAQAAARPASALLPPQHWCGLFPVFPDQPQAPPLRELVAVPQHKPSQLRVLLLAHSLAWVNLRRL